MHKNIKYIGKTIVSMAKDVSRFMTGTVGDTFKCFLEIRDGVTEVPKFFLPRTTLPQDLNQVECFSKGQTPLSTIQKVLSK